MRETGGCETARRDELVVCPEQRGGRVQDPGAGALDQQQLEEPGLDSVERREDVEAPEHGGSLPKAGSELERRYTFRIDPALAPGRRELRARFVRLGRRNDDPRRGRVHQPIVEGATDRAIG
jgi:hypothetical protein